MKNVLVDAGSLGHFGNEISVNANNRPPVIYLSNKSAGSEIWNCFDEIANKLVIANSNAVSTNYMVTEVEFYVDGTQFGYSCKAFDANNPVNKERFL